MQQTHVSEAYATMVKLFTGLTEIVRQANAQSTAAEQIKCVPNILEQLGAVPVGLPMETSAASNSTPGSRKLQGLPLESTMTKNEGGGTPKSGA